MSLFTPLPICNVKNCAYCEEALGNIKASCIASSGPHIIDLCILMERDKNLLCFIKNAGSVIQDLVTVNWIENNVLRRGCG